MRDTPDRDCLDSRLLDEFQRDLPLMPRPFAAMAESLNTSEGEVLARLRGLRDRGCIARVAGASTLAALSIPPARIERVAAIVGAEPGVNHSYLREDDWNLWFVATAPSDGDLADSLARIEAASGLAVLSLPLEQPFNIDLGFRLRGTRAAMILDCQADMTALRDDDRSLMQALSGGLALVSRPFAELAGDRILDLGAQIGALPFVIHCYQRPHARPQWPYNLFAMLHGQSRSEVEAKRDEVSAILGDACRGHDILYSTRILKKTGLRLRDD